MRRRAHGVLEAGRRRGRPPRTTRATWPRGRRRRALECGAARASALREWRRRGVAHAEEGGGSLREQPRRCGPGLAAKEKAEKLKGSTPRLEGAVRPGQGRAVQAAHLRGGVPRRGNVVRRRPRRGDAPRLGPRAAILRRSSASPSSRPADGAHIPVLRGRIHSRAPCSARARELRTRNTLLALAGAAGPSLRPHDAPQPSFTTPNHAAQPGAPADVAAAFAQCLAFQRSYRAGGCRRPLGFWPRLPRQNKFWCPRTRPRKSARARS